MKNGKCDKNGEFQPIGWKQAFDIMEQKCKATLKAKGPTGVGMFGSGQWTIWESHAANKLIKAGLRSNNIEPNARHCMASAAFGFIRTFGADEPMGCYDDAEAAGAFVLWGRNMAEMHPILCSRIINRRLTAKHVKVHVLSTFSHRRCEVADVELIFEPQNDLAILNDICHHIISSGAVSQDFVRRHVSFAKGVTDIGYGLRANPPLEQVAGNNGYPGPDDRPKGNPMAAGPIGCDEFKQLVATYTLDYTSQLSCLRTRLRTRASAHPRTGRVCEPKSSRVATPFFDEHRLANRLTLDATCPISKETDFKQCAVKVVKA